MKTFELRYEYDDKSIQGVEQEDTIECWATLARNRRQYRFARKEALKLHNGKKPESYRILVHHPSTWGKDVVTTIEEGIF